MTITRKFTRTQFDAARRCYTNPVRTLTVVKKDDGTWSFYCDLGVGYGRPTAEDAVAAGCEHMRACGWRELSCDA